MRRILVPLLSILFFVGVLAMLFMSKEVQVPQKPKSTSVVVPSVQPTVTESESVVMGEFTGNIPCPDCSGITLRLTLYQDSDTGEPLTYSLQQTKSEAIAAIDSEQGTWGIIKGTPENSKAVIYGLNLDEPVEKQRYFLKVSEDKIIMLDKNKHQFPGKGNYTLVKTKK